MASYKWIFTLTVTLKLVSTSSAFTCFRANNKVQPEGGIEVVHGDGILTAGIVGRDFRQPDDHYVHGGFALFASNGFGKITREKTFKTDNGEIITWIHVWDCLPFRTPGVRIDLVENGPGYKNATLRFTSKRRVGINKCVAMFGRNVYH